MIYVWTVNCRDQVLGGRRIGFEPGGIGRTLEGDNCR